MLPVAFNARRLSRGAAIRAAPRFLDLVQCDDDLFHLSRPLDRIGPALLRRALALSGLLQSGDELVGNTAAAPDVGAVR